MDLPTVPPATTQDLHQAVLLAAVAIQDLPATAVLPAEATPVPAAVQDPAVLAAAIQDPQVALAVAIQEAVIQEVIHQEAPIQAEAVQEATRREGK